MRLIGATEICSFAQCHKFASGLYLALTCSLPYSVILYYHVFIQSNDILTGLKKLSAEKGLSKGGKSCAQIW
jgi:hypothetical protein